MRVAEEEGTNDDRKTARNQGIGKMLTRKQERTKGKKVIQ
jgi:hypothetical protein